MNYTFQIMKSYVLGFCFFCGALALPVAAVECRAGDYFTPERPDGAAWDVTAIYASPDSAGTFSKPLQLRYQVGHSKKEDADDIYRIHAACIEGGPNANGVFFYRKENHSMCRAEFSRVFRSNPVQEQFVSESIRPASFSRSIFPCDSPVFPLSPDAVIEFTYVEMMHDGLKSLNSIFQKVTTGFFQDARLPARWRDRRLFKVECLDQKGVVIFMQYWAEHLPWPVYGENQSMRYWLEEK